MGSKRTKQRRVSARVRTAHFVTAYNPGSVPRQYKMAVPPMEHLMRTWLINQDEIERRTFTYLTAQGVDPSLWEFYLALVRRGFMMYMNFWDATAATERAALRQEFILRHLVAVDIDAILDIARTVAGLVR